MHVELNRMMDHMEWADRKLLDVLNASTEARQERVLRLLSHLLAAERVWLLRLQGEESGTRPIWPDWTLDELNTIAGTTALAYRQLVAGLSEPDMDRRIEYKNSQGVTFHTRVSDILTHVVLHGSYHRGQIAAALRAGDVEPVNTDYITYVRALDAQISGP